MAAVIAPALAVPAAVLAEINPRQSHQQPATQSQIQLQRDDLRVSQVEGMQVKNAQGEDIGDVKDVVIDTRSGRVEYVALSHGGFLGIGEDLFAYPVSQFTRGQDREALVLNTDVTEEQLEEREGFNDDNWPQVRADRDYWAELERRFGTQGEASSGASAQPARQERSHVRASEIVGQQVQDRSGKDIGEVKDMVLSLRDGEIRFAVIDTAGDDTLVPVPMDALSLRDDGGEQVLRYERDRMDLSRAFDKSDWPEEVRR